jgi:hypothetical protein
VVDGNGESALGDEDTVVLSQNWVAYLTARIGGLQTTAASSSGGNGGAGSGAATSGSNLASTSTLTSSGVNAALVHKVQNLQDENEELYEAISRNEMGHLKEEVRSLRSTVEKLESALKGMLAYNIGVRLVSDTSVNCLFADSHSIVESLTCVMHDHCCAAC